MFINEIKSRFMTKTLAELKENYKNACNDYVIAFCKKQTLSFEGWVDDVGGIALCGEFYFNLGDIVYDINSSQPKARIKKWYDDCLMDSKNSVNYYSYTKCANP